jgi:hypothetical protein
VLNNPVGYNRMYVQMDGALTYRGWWDGLRAGRVFVTNGPLLRVRAGGKPPGHVFIGAERERLEIPLDAKLTAQDPITAIEIIKDGRVERRVAYDEWLRTGTLGRVAFEQSGWFLVRAIAENPETFRFASTGPYYVELGPGARRISRTSVQFFVDWARQRARALEGELTDPHRRQDVLLHHASAEQFWADLLNQANAE